MRQKLFDELHYVESSSGTAYGRKLTSDFSLQRMLDGQPEWLQPTVLKRKPKTLVIADDLLVFASSVKKAKLTDTLRALLDKERTQPPFAIFIWTKNGLRELNEELLNTNDWIGDVIGGKPEDITKAAAKKSISKSSLKIIDEYWRDCLCQGDVLPEHTLYASELISAYETKEGPQAGRLHRLKQRNPTCTGIVTDQYYFNEEPTKTMDTVWRSFSGIPSYTMWQELRFPSAILKEYLTDTDRSITNANQPQPGDIQALIDVTVDELDSAELEMLAKQAPNLRRLKVTEDLTGSIDSMERIILPNLGIFELPGMNFSIQTLDCILKICPNIKQLIVGGIVDIEDSDALAELNSLKGLHTLDCSQAFGVSTFSSAMSVILNVIPNLKVLDLASFTDSARLSLKSQALSNLCSLNLKGTISAQHFGDLLIHAKKLKHLNLIKEIDIQGVLHLEAGALVELETIVLNYKISTVMLSEILSNCHKLKHIDLSYSVNLQGDIDLAPNSLPYVETIDLSKAKISAEVLTKLLKACPNLRTLKLGNAESHKDFSYRAIASPVVRGDLLLEPYKLPHLEYLDLSYLDASSQTLNQLLKSSSSIRKITFQHCNLCAEVFSQVSLPLLEEATPRMKDINSQTLSALLQACPNVREIDISSCKKVTSLFLGKLVLPNVVTINVTASGINSQGLQELLSACPNVKYFHAFNLELTSPITLAKGSLSKLENIRLSGTSITMDILQELLNASPNLTDLLLGSCENLETDVHYELRGLSKLNAINFEYSKLSGHSFASILKAAPNIERLYLSACVVNGGFTLAPNSLPHLENIDGFLLLNREVREMLARAAPQLADEILAEPKTKTPVPSGLPAQTTGNTSSSATESKTPVTPQHDLDKLKNFTPHDESQPFAFDPTQKVKNQGMLINKLCQYLTITNQHTAMIPKLQDGICKPLAFYFIDKGHAEMEAFLDRALAWDGSVATLSPRLAREFIALYAYVDRYQLNQTVVSEDLFLGDNMREFLSGFDVGQKAVLTNPWHGAAVEKISATEYCWYDPNGVEGVKIYQLEEQIQVLNSQLGQQIGVATPVEEIKGIERVADSNQFIAQGGLMSLCKYRNFSQALFEQLTAAASTMDAESLDGLLLRGTSGMPAWIIATKSSDPRIKALTLRLLERFKITHGAQANAELLASMSAMNGMARQALAEELTTAIETFPQAHASVAISEDLIALCRRTEAQKAYKEELSPWEKSAVTHESILALKQTLLQSSEETVNRLLRCSSDASVFGLTAQLVAMAGQGDRQNEHSVFYIDGPEDLVCASPYVERDGKAIEFKKGPGGALYDFLENCKQKNIRPAIVVNYARFEPADMVAFNALLDSHDARADGTPLPNKTRVIGVLNIEHPDVYQGSDFYSRFDEKYDSPFTDQEIELEGIRGQGAEEHKLAESDKVVINLFHSADWKSRLLGACVLDGTKMFYEKGELVDALTSGAPLEIHNGPWNDPEFRSFWHHLTVGRGVYHAGKWYKMGDQQVVEPIEGYNWEALGSHLQAHVGLSRAKPPVLNSHNLSTFLGGYIYVEKVKGLIQQTGSIAEHSGSTLDVNLTENLSADIWARILSVCKAKGIRLNAHCAPGIRLPTELAVEPVAVPALAAFTLDEEPTTGFKVVVSQDRETTLRMLKRRQPEANVISVSGLTPEDLLTHIKTNFDRDKASLSVSSEDGVLNKELAKEKPVILTGVFTQELVQALTAFALNQEVPPNITLLTEDGAEFTHLADFAMQHAVTIADKLSVLPVDANTKLPQQLIAAESVNKIEARLKYMAHNPDSAFGDEAWAGMEKLPARIEIEDEPLDFSKSAAAARAFHANRKGSVMSCLADSPYCYLTGLTGVGKTTFVEKTFIKKNGYTLFHEAPDIQAWAQSRDANPVLFLDEANMSEQDWAIFEGLFHEPRRIIIDGIPYPISPEHKLIFAGNPCSYGDERQNNPFFDSYGSAVLCKPLSKAVIYEDILKPVFNESGFSEADIQAASQDILAAYTTICRSSQDEILMTPRELQMIALLSLSDAKRSGIALSSAVKGNILAVCGSALENKPSILQRINLDYATDAVKVPADFTQIPPTFHVTPSLEPILSQVQSLIELRNFRRTQASINEQQAYGGLGGIVLEGEPGCGKSELMVHALVAAGYAEEHDHINPTTKENLFYKVSASMSLKEKKALLEKAFVEGAVVLMDEINSSPMMEHMLNAMLMGYHPETHARGKPGFMVFGTQNPVSMAGRRVASPALRRRMLAMNVPEQSKDELCAILASKTSYADLSIELMVDTYIERRSYALKKHLYPVPCFRDLEKLAHRTSTVTPESTPEFTSRATTPELTSTKPITVATEPISEDYAVNQGENLEKECADQSPASSSSVGFFKQTNPVETRPTAHLEEISTNDLTNRLSKYIETRKARHSYYWDFLGIMAFWHCLSPQPWPTSRETKVAAATYAKLSVEQNHDAGVRFLTAPELSDNTSNLTLQYKNSYVLVTDKKGVNSLFYVDYDGNKRQVRLAKTEGLAILFADNPTPGSYSLARTLLKSHVTDLLPTDAQLVALKHGELANAANGISPSVLMGLTQPAGNEGEIFDTFGNH